MATQKTPDSKKKTTTGGARQGKDTPDDGGQAPEAEATLAVEGDEELAFLRRQADEQARDKSELLDSLRRLQAEFENYRKRMVKEQTRILETAEADLIRKLLPVVDNLERALANSSGEGSDKGLREGVALVLGQILSILEKEGLEIVDPRGEPFDPEHHEAMMVVESDKCPEDTVIEVAQKGYRFNGKLLRPAMVHVSCPVKSEKG